MRALLRAGTALVLASGLVVPLAGVDPPAAGAVASRPAMPSDFNGDGFADLAIGVPGENLRRGINAGAVQVIYGSARGITTRDQFWHQDRRGIRGTVEKGDRFGSTLASADFDSDGYADLAIGVPGENVGAVADAGRVQVLYGGRKGLTTRDQLWQRGMVGVPGELQSGDRFGSELAAADFDGDEYADLAVMGSGKVPLVVLRGSASGLTANAAMSREWAPGDDMEGFGTALAAGDVNGDGFADLMVRVSLEGPDGAYGGHVVRVLLTNANGLGAVGTQDIDLQSLGLEYGEIAGVTLTDFNRDGRQDLALVLPTRQRVVVLHGSTEGFHPAPLSVSTTPGTDAFWTVPAGWNYAGWGDLTGGDFTGDGAPDLAIEVRGYIAVIKGTASGLGPTMTQWPVVGNNSALRVLALSGGARPWLVIGRGTALVGRKYGGAVTVIRGTLSGTPGRPRTITQNSRRILDRTESGDGFGAAIA